MDDVNRMDVDAPAAPSDPTDDMRALHGVEAAEIVKTTRLDVLLHGKLGHTLPFLEHVLALAGVLPADSVFPLNAALVENGAPCIVVRNAHVWAVATFFDKEVRGGVVKLAGDDNLFMTIDTALLRDAIVSTIGKNDGVLLFEGPLRLSTDTCFVLNFRRVECPWLLSFSPQAALHISDGTVVHTEEHIAVFAEKHFPRLDTYMFVIPEQYKRAFASRFFYQIAALPYSSAIMRLLGSNVIARRSFAGFFFERAYFTSTDLLFSEGVDQFFRALLRRAAPKSVGMELLDRRSGGGLVPRENAPEIDLPIDFVDADKAYSFFSQRFAAILNTRHEPLQKSLLKLARHFTRWHMWLELERNWMLGSPRGVILFRRVILRVLSALQLNFDAELIKHEVESLTAATNIMPVELANKKIPLNSLSVFSALFNPAYNFFLVIHRILYRRFYGQVAEYAGRVHDFLNSQLNERNWNFEPPEISVKRIAGMGLPMRLVVAHDYGVVAFPAPIELVTPNRYDRVPFGDAVGAVTRNYIAISQTATEPGWDRERKLRLPHEFVVAVFFEPEYMLVKESLDVAPAALPLLVVHRAHIEMAVGRATVDENFYFRSKLYWLVYDEVTPVEAVSRAILHMNQLDFSTTKFGSFIRLPQIPPRHFLYSMGSAVKTIPADYAVTQAHNMMFDLSGRFRWALFEEMNAFRAVAVANYEHIQRQFATEAFFRFLGVPSADSPDLLDAAFLVLRMSEHWPANIQQSLRAVTGRMRAILQRMFHSAAFAVSHGPSDDENPRKALAVWVDYHERKEKTMIYYNIFIRDTEPRRNIACSIIQVELAPSGVGRLVIN